MNKRIDSNINLKNILEKEDLDSQRISELETQDFSEEKLDQTSKKNKHKRTEGGKTTIYWGNLFLIVVIYMITIIGILIFAYHLFIPDTYYFLNQDQLKEIKILLFSALATTLAKEFINRNG